MIVILGILAAIVVFAVSGISDRGQAAACKADIKTLRVAEEANYAKFSAYTSVQATLVSNGFLSAPSTLHTINVPGSGSANYDFTPVAPCTAAFDAGA